MLVACDIDGTLADNRDFLYLLPSNWEEYYRHTLDLKPIEPIVAIVKSLIGDPANEVVFVTARPEYTRFDTLLWLKRYLPKVGLILMRQNRDIRPNAVVKLEIYKDLKPNLILEDEPTLAEKLVKESFVVIQVHGFRLTGEDFIPGVTSKAR